MMGTCLEFRSTQGLFQIQNSQLPRCSRELTEMQIKPSLCIVQNTKKKDSSPLQELELKNLLCISQPDLIILVGNGFCMTGLLAMEVSGFETVQEYKENGKWES